MYHILSINYLAYILVQSIFSLEGVGSNNVMISPMGHLFIKNPTSVLGISGDNTSSKSNSSRSSDDGITSKPLLLLLDCFSYLTYPDNEAIYR